MGLQQKGSSLTVHKWCMNVVQTENVHCEILFMDISIIKTSLASELNTKWPVESFMLLFHCSFQFK